MAKDVRCRQCDSTNVELYDENKRGLSLVVFEVWCFARLLYRWVCGTILLVGYDWWMAIARRGHIWQSKRQFTGKGRVYYCHNCGNSFRT